MPSLNVDGATVAYSDIGAPASRLDAPTIVFGHGLLFSGWMFRHQIAALRDDYRCVAIDWRGQGDSPPARGGYDMDTLTGDALALIDVLGTAPVHWVGLSMGGFVGQRIAARRPELLRSLTLIDTSAEREGRWDSIQYGALASIYPFVGPRVLRREVERAMFSPTFRRDSRSRAVIDEWMDTLANTDRAGIRKAVLGVTARRPVIDEIGSIKARTLVIVGADDKATPPARSRTIVSRIKDARLEIVPDAGHSSTIEQPEAVTALLTSFLAEVDATPRAARAD